MNAKIEAIRQQSRMEVEYAEAIRAITSYRATAFDDAEEEIDDED